MLRFLGVLEDDVKIFIIMQSVANGLGKERMFKGESKASPIVYIGILQFSTFTSQ